MTTAAVVPGGGRGHRLPGGREAEGRHQLFGSIRAALRANNILDTDRSAYQFIKPVVAFMALKFVYGHGLSGFELLIF
jgi:hypothetical protein